MNTKITICILMLVALLTGCAKEETPEPSGLDRNWLVIEEKPGELNRLIYEVYRSTGIPVFVNDTLGMEVRGMDAYGNPVIHYERFDLGYKVEGKIGNAALVLSSDTSAMLETVRMLRDLVIPHLPKEHHLRPQAFLLGDTLKLSDYGCNLTAGRSGSPAWVYKDLMGIAVGRVCDIPQMNELQRKFWAGMILAANAGSTVYDDFPDEIEKFYNVSLMTGTRTYHTQRGTYMLVTGIKSTNPNYDWEPGEMGFLEYTINGIEAGYKGQLVKQCPSKELDAQYYLAAVYAWTEEEFASLYGAWPKCMEKYRMMKDIVEAYEAKGKN